MPEQTLKLSNSKTASTSLRQSYRNWWHECVDYFAEHRPALVLLWLLIGIGLLEVIRMVVVANELRQNKLAIDDNTATINSLDTQEHVHRAQMARWIARVKEANPTLNLPELP